MEFFWDCFMKDISYSVHWTVLKKLYNLPSNSTTMQNCEPEYIASHGMVKILEVHKAIHIFFFYFRGGEGEFGVG